LVVLWPFSWLFISSSFSLSSWFFFSSSVALLGMMEVYQGPSPCEAGGRCTCGHGFLLALDRRAEAL